MKKEVVIFVLVMLMVGIFTGILYCLNRSNFRQEVLKYCQDDKEICLCIADEAHTNGVTLGDFRLFIKQLAREDGLLRLFLIQDETAITMMKATIKCGGTL